MKILRLKSMAPEIKNAVRQGSRLSLPYQMQHSGKWALLLSWAAQQS